MDHLAEIVSNKVQGRASHNRNDSFHKYTPSRSSFLEIGQLQPPIINDELLSASIERTTLIFPHRYRPFLRDFWSPQTYEKRSEEMSRDRSNETFEEKPLEVYVE